MESIFALQPKGATGPVLAALSANRTLRHNIPNAWMASPPGHPFWQVGGGFGLGLMYVHPRE